MRGDLIQAYKIFNNLDDIDPSSVFQLSPSTATRSSGDKIYIQYSRTNRRKFAFSNRVAPVWNALASTIKSSTNINTFKNRLDQDTNFIDSLYDYND